MKVSEFYKLAYDTQYVNNNLHLAAAMCQLVVKNFPEDIKDNDDLDNKNTSLKIDKKEKDGKTSEKDDVKSNLTNVDDGFIYNENKNNKSSTKNVANRVYQIFRPNRNKVTKDKENLNRPREKNDIDYDEVKSLRIEAVQKLKQYRPLSIGQASRISGVSPADISVLLIYLETYDYSKES